MAAEMCLMQLPTMLADPSAEFVPSAFFSEQLTAFELWLQHGSKDKKPPEQLPIVLQVWWRVEPGRGCVGGKGGGRGEGGWIKWREGGGKGQEAAGALPILLQV